MNRRTERLPSRRQRGVTFIELLVVIAILGIIANFLMPAMILQLAKGQAARIVSEYKLLEHAVHSYTTDAGVAPRPWFSSSEHPDLRRYLRGRIDYQQPGLGLTKIFLRDPERSRTPFRSGYLLYSYRSTPLLEIIERNFDGRVEVYWPGRLIVLVIEG